MSDAIFWLEKGIRLAPLPVLEAWGKIAYLLGTLIAFCAFGGITCRAGGRWTIGWERYQWDNKSFFSVPITFVLIILSGYLGSFVTLVPGAQTLESAKDLAVFVCILYFGYPALITVPFAYGLSDLIEGVPLESLIEWSFGYFMNPAFYWIGYQLLDRDPDFRKPGVWARYIGFVVFFMSFQPILWGYICSQQFTPALAYARVSVALVITGAITWILAPLVGLISFPMVKRLQYHWAGIPCHVKQRPWSATEWSWVKTASSTEAGKDPESTASLPVRMFLLAPFLFLMLSMMVGTAAVTLRGAESDTAKLVTLLHREYSENLTLQLDRLFSGGRREQSAVERVSEVLREGEIDSEGRVFVLGPDGTVVASSAARNDRVVRDAVRFLAQQSGHSQIGSFTFDQVREDPLSLVSWLGFQTPYTVPDSERTRWTLVILMPKSYYLKGIRAGHSRAGTMFVVAMLAAIAVATFLSGVVTSQLRSLARSASRLADGDLKQRATAGRFLHLQELETLAEAFNTMASRLDSSFAELHGEVDQRKAAESRLLEHQVDLEEQVRSRTSELSKVLERAEAASEAKSRFLALMSHELRTPLNAVLGYAQLLLRDKATMASNRAHLDAIHSNGEHLLRLLNDVLEMSQMESGQQVLNHRAFNPRVLIGETVAMFAPAALEAGLVLSEEFQPDLPLVIEQDSAKLRQILINLIDNALKFTQFGSIQICCRTVTGERGLNLVVTVEDTGCGMAADDLNLIFESFSQLENGARVGGVGLGLSICQRFAQQMGGSIKAFSEPGKGSLFELSIPVGCGSEEEASEPSGSEFQSPEPSVLLKVLLTNESRLSRALSTSYLVASGFSIRVLPRVPLELDQSLQWDPDFVIVDVGGPDCEGLSIIRKLGERAVAGPILAIDGSPDGSLARLLFEHGADYVLAGNGDPREALSILRSSIPGSPGSLSTERYAFGTEAESDSERLSKELLKAPPELRLEIEAAARAARPSLLVELSSRLEAYSTWAAEEMRETIERFAYHELLVYGPEESNETTPSRERD